MASFASTDRSQKEFEAVTRVKKLVKEEHSITLAQLASRISATINFGVGRWRGCVREGDGFYRGVINRLQARSQRRPANFRELSIWT